jgi:uncharacterized protein
MNRLPVIIVAIFVFFLLDLYAFQAVKTLTKSLSTDTRRWVHGVYWAVPIVSVVVWVVTQFLIPPDALPRATRQFIWTAMLIPYFAKFFAIIPILIDDIIRFLRWIFSFFGTQNIDSQGQVISISRSEFLMKAAGVLGATTVVGFIYGIVSGAHDYRVRRVKMAIKNLPKGFEGLRIAQLSDIHSGSFFDKKAVQRGVQMLLNEKPELVFFTGDLVNNTATEVEPYIDVFKKITAPLGVYSVLGNHDYGDYYQWPSEEAKSQNLKDLKNAHRRMGWQLLLDEHKILTRNGDQLPLIGIQNWGMGGFAQYGDLAKAHRGTEHYAAKLLLSHDPSHWDAQVRTQYPDISAAFAGHTHGMQFGVEIGSFKWSPVKYRYKQWAGLHTEDAQHLYVNRGFGYIGYPGRIGIFPEITIIELTRA